MAEDRTWPENSWSFSIQKALDSGEGQLMEMEMLDACMITFPRCWMKMASGKTWMTSTKMTSPPPRKAQPGNTCMVNSCSSSSIYETLPQVPVGTMVIIQHHIWKHLQNLKSLQRLEIIFLPYLSLQLKRQGTGKSKTWQAAASNVPFC